MARESERLLTGGFRRMAKVGTALAGAGVQGARGKHEEAAARMVRSIGQLKGGAAKIAQLASFIDTDFIPDEYAGVYRGERARRRAGPRGMPFRAVRAVLGEEWGEPVSELFDS